MTVGCQDANLGSVGGQMRGGLCGGRVLRGGSGLWRCCRGRSGVSGEGQGARRLHAHGSHKSHPKEPSRRFSGQVMTATNRSFPDVCYAEVTPDAQRSSPGSSAGCTWYCGGGAAAAAAGASRYGLSSRPQICSTRLASVDTCSTLRPWQHELSPPALVFEEQQHRHWWEVIAGWRYKCNMCVPQALPSDRQAAHPHSSSTQGILSISKQS